MELATKTLIRACRFKPPGGQWTFMVTPKGGFYPSIGVALYIDHAVLRRAAIQALQSNTSALLGHTLTDVSSLLLKALERDFPAFLDRWFSAYTTNGSLADVCAEDDIVRLTAAVVRETSFESTQKWWLILAKGFLVDKPLVSSKNLIWQGADRTEDLQRVIGGGQRIDLQFFPPLKADLRRSIVTSSDTWLGVQAGTEVQAVGQLSQMLGAISLALTLPGSRMFSGAATLEGLVSISANGSWSYSIRGPAFPPILSRAHLSEDRIEWLGRLLDGSERASQMDLRIRTSLDYVQAGWVPASRVGFLHNAIAFDALFGEDGKVTKSIVAGVTTHANDIPKIESRIRALLRMRNALVHGAAASVELTADYLPYWDLHDSDPHNDQVHILQRCLQRLVP